MSLVSAAPVANNVVATPQVNTSFLNLDNYFTYNPLIRKEDMMAIDPDINDRDIMAIAEFTGNVEVTHDLEYRNYEANQMFRAPKLASVTGTGDEITITLTADSYSTKGGVAMTSIIRNDLLMTRGRAYGFLNTKTSNGTSSTFTVRRPIGSTVNLAAALNDHLTNNVPLFIFSNAHGEGTLQPTEGLERETSFWVNQVQHIKTSRFATGDVEMLKIVDTTGADNYIRKQEIEMGSEHRWREKFAIYLSSGEDFLDTVENKTVRTTMGIDPSIRAMGNVFSHSKSTGLTQADWDIMADQVHAIRIGNDIQIHAGNRVYGQWQKLFRELVGTAGGQIDYSLFGQGNRSRKAVDIGFNSVHYRGTNWHLIQSDLFSIPQMTGISGYNFPDSFFFMPGGPQSIQVSNGAEVTRVSVPALRLRYAARNSGMLRYDYWPRGKHLTNRDVQEQHLHTQVGAQFTSMRKYGLSDGV